jgi:hypothetical protein
VDYINKYPNGFSQNNIVLILAKADAILAHFTLQLKLEAIDFTLCTLLLR